MHNKKANLPQIITILAFIGLILTLIWGYNLDVNIPKLDPKINQENNKVVEDSSIYFINPCVTPGDAEILFPKHNRSGDTIMVKATMYQATPYQCDDSPDVTADQTKIPNIDSCSHLNWIAVSQDLLWFNDGPIRYGDTVYVIAGHKTGYYIVHDAMNKRWTNKIDFLESIGVEAYKYNKAELIINS
tara:strand:- start:701 stop:1261 length:561 start_codon:yes stop_codon:yes gene_type:complete